MKAGVVGSMQFAEKMLEMGDELNKLGQCAFLTDLHRGFHGKTNEEKEALKLKRKYNNDAIREFWRAMQGADAILVLNFDKHGIKNYIGGNTFLEMGFAHVPDQKIFLLHPIPEMIYKTEIIAMKPTVIYGDLSKIK